MSDPPEKKNPWAKLLAKQGGALSSAPAPTTPPPVQSPVATPAAKPVARPAVPANPFARSLAKQGLAIPSAGAPAAVRPSTGFAAPAPPANPPPRPPPAVRPRPESGASPTARSVFAKPPAARPVPSAAGAPPARTAAPPPSAHGESQQVSDELADALSKLAAEYAPLPITSAPFVSAKERELEIKEERRRQVVWLLKRGASVLLVLGLLAALSTVALFRAPSDENLAAEVAKTAQLVLPLYSTSDQPLQIDRAVAVLSDTFDRRYLRYYAEVTLRLREPLYGPAITNGTIVYRQLQESLRLAREQELKLNLFPMNDGPKAPELPRLIQLLHRAGEPLVVRLPFEARKFGWKWRIEPPQLAKRVATARFDGEPLRRFSGAPYLVFGVPETMAEFHERIGAARDYVTTITKEVQRSGVSGSDREPGLGEPPSIEVPAVVAPDPDPALNVDPDKPAIDPNKPAADPTAISVPGLPPPVDPNRPAVVPEKPTKPH